MWSDDSLVNDRCLEVGDRGGHRLRGAVISKYRYMPMIVPLLGLLVSVRGVKRSGRALAVFLSAAGMILAAYFSLFFGALFPTSKDAYLDQTFGRSRGHIAALQVVFGLASSARWWRDGDASNC